METIKWRWDHEVYVPFCPHCDNPAYNKKKCAFCGRSYKWEKSEIKPTVVEHNGYTVIQCTNNDILVYKNGRIIMQLACIKRKTVEELKEFADAIQTYKKEER